MAIEFEIQGSLLRVRADAAGTEAEVRDGIERATHHPDFRRRCAVLVDVRAVQDAPDTSLLASTGQLLAKEGGPHFSRVAFVTAGPLQFGLSRILGSHADAGGLDVQVFESEDEALSWLGQASHPSAHP